MEGITKNNFFDLARAATVDPWIDPEVEMPDGDEEVILLFTDSRDRTGKQVGQGHFDGEGWCLAWYFDFVLRVKKVHGWQKLPTAPK
jgi:hypothetical protein